MTAPPRVAAIMCAHNQAAQVAESVRAIVEQTTSAQIDVFLVDDGSVDGTTLVAEMAGAHVLPGSGQLYWGGGTRKAAAAALAAAPTFLLMVNADTVLRPGAVPVLLSKFHEGKADWGTDPIVVGATTDSSGYITYSGLRRAPGRGLRLERVHPTDGPTVVDTFNGNVVLLSAHTWRALGGIDPAFPHQMGDVDLGLRASRNRVPILLASVPLAWCESHETQGTSREFGLSRRARFRRRTGVKELAPAPWFRLTRRYGGPWWPALFVKPYIDALVWNR